MVFGTINIVFVNIMALLAKEYGLMGIGSAGVIVLAGYVPVGIGLVAIGPIHGTWDFIEDRYIDMMPRFTYKNRDADTNMVMGMSMGTSMDMGVVMSRDTATDMNMGMKTSMLTVKQD